MNFSIVIPVFNEKKNISLLISKILSTLKKKDYENENIYKPNMSLLQ